MSRHALLPRLVAFALVLPFGGCATTSADDTGGSDDSTTGADATTADGGETGGETGDPNWPQTQAEAFCSTLYSCDCSATPPPYADEADCVATLQGFYAELDAIDLSRDDLQHNWECLAVLPQLAEQYGCDEAWPDEVTTSCAVVHGSKNWGNTCANYTAPGWYEQYSDCGTNLICDATQSAQGYCVDREPVPYAGGETCWFEPFAFECEAGFVCDFEQTEYCNPVPSIGEACISGQCDTDAWCNPTQGLGEGLCEARGADGAGCQRDEQCLSDSCVGGTCAPAPEAPVLLCALPKPGP